MKNLFPKVTKIVLFVHKLCSHETKNCSLRKHLIISYHIISYHIISYHIISYHIISYHIISYHIISYHIISYHIISYHISYLYKSYTYNRHIHLICIIFIYIIPMALNIPSLLKITCLVHSR